MNNVNAAGLFLKSCYAFQEKVGIFYENILYIVYFCPDKQTS